jgi:hypothetical protein
MNMEGEGFSIPIKKMKPTDEPKRIETVEDKTGDAQEVLVPVFNERLSPENVLNYMFEKKKYSYDGLAERSV